MNKFYKLVWVGLTCALAGGVSAQTYVSPISAYQDITTTGETFTFTFVNPPTGAHSTAHVTVFYEGDFGDSGEDIEVMDEDGNTLGFAGPNSAGDCAPEDSAVFSFPAADINTWLADNNVDFVLTTSFDVDAGNCIPTHIRVRLTYEYCNFGVPQEFAAITLTDSVFCSYDSPVTLIGTPAGGTFSGTGVSGSTFNPAGLDAGIYEVTYAAADAFGCTTHQTKEVRINRSPETLDAHACPGGTAVLEVDAGAGDYVWYTNTGLTQVLDSGTVVTSPTLTQSTTYYVAGLTSDNSFEVLTLTDVNGTTVDHESESGDDNAGIAITPDYLYIVGNEGTVRLDASDLGNPTALPIRDGIFSDLKTGKLWAFWSTQTNESISYDVWNFPFTCDAFRGLDSDLVFTNEYIYLSAPIEIGDNDQGGVFAGYGKTGLFNGGDSHYYVVDLDNGLVEDLGAGSQSFFYGENWADWGVLEYDGTTYSALYRDGSGGNDIIRQVLPSGPTTTVQSFSDVSDLAAFTFSPWNNRWYFHYEGGGEFGGIDETGGYADGTFSTTVLSAGEVGCYSAVEVDINTIDLGADQTLCDYEAPAILFAGLGFSSYTWNGDNNNFNAFPVMESGTYTVEATDEYGCTITDAATVTVLPCLGIEEVELGFSATLFPNPSNGISNLRVESAMSQDFTLEVLDMTGKRLYSTRLMGVSGTYTHSLDVSTWSAGVYTVRLVGSEKGSKQIRLIKQ